MNRTLVERVAAELRGWWEEGLQGAWDRYDASALRIIAMVRRHDRKHDPMDGTRETDSGGNRV